MSDIAKELVEDGKTTVRYAIESLRHIQKELDGKAEDDTKVIMMLNDLGLQIEMLTAMQGKIRRHVKLQRPTPTPAPYAVLESSPT